MSNTPPAAPLYTPTAHEARRLAVESCRDPRAVRNAYAGTAKSVTVESVRQAAQRLGITPPPPVAR